MAMTDPMDLRGLKCPLPAMLARKALAKLAPGTALTVLADDPMSAVDIPHMCHGEGHAVTGMTPRDGFLEFALIAAGAAAADYPPVPEA